MASVASQIRIDLLANAAGFNAGMRSGAREGYGGFREETEKFDRWFNSRKPLAERVAKEREAWQSAMGGHRSDVYSLDYRDLGSTALPNWLRREKAMSEARMPFGYSRRTSLGAEEAERAAVFGSGMDEEGRGGGGGGFRGGRRFVGSLLRREGMGAFGPLFGGMMENISGATIGVAAFGAGVLAARSAATSLGNEIKQTREEALKLGMTYDQYVAQKGLPQHSRFVEGAALSATAGYEGAKGFGTGVWGGMVNAANFMVDLPGNFARHARMQVEENHDVSSLADAAREEDKGKLLEQKMLAGIKLREQAGEGLDHLRSKVEALNTSEEQAARNEWIKKFKPDADQIAEWDKLTAAIHRAKAGELATPGFDKWREAKYGEGFNEDEKYRKEGQAGGMSREEIEGNLRLFRERRGETDSLTRANAIAKSLSLETPEQKRDQALADADLWHSYHNRRMEDERAYQQMRRKAVQDYYKEAEGLDAEAIRKRLRSGHEEYQRDLANLKAHGRDAGLTPDELGRETGRRGDEERKRLGIRDPLGDFAKDVEEHRKALADGTITQKEFDQWFSGRRQSAVGELAGDTPSIRLNGAMAAGSAEAHSLIAQSSVADPRTKAAIDAVNALNRIATLLESGKAVDDQILRALSEAII